MPTLGIWATFYPMREISAKDAKDHFGQFLSWAQREPVRITRRGRPAGVLVSEEQYQQLLGAAWDKLNETVTEMGKEAKSKGLTEDKLRELLDGPD